MTPMIFGRICNWNLAQGARILSTLLLLLVLTWCKFEAEANTRATETVTEVSIVMAEDDWDALRHTARSPEVVIPVCGSVPPESPYEYVPATVTVGGVTLENVGVRAKGFFGSVNPVRRSLKIKFDEFVEGQTLGETKRLTLNNNNQDYTRMRTCLALRVFQKAGLPASDCGFAHVAVNGKDLGVYSSVEPIKKPFLRKHFADDEGNLYEAQLGDFLPELINSFERKTNDATADDRSDLEAAMMALEADDADLLNELGAVIDLDAFLGFWAMEILLAHWDSYTGNMNNYYIYNDPTTGKFTFIPWGPDAAFSEKEEILQINSVGPLFANSALSKRLYDHPEGRELFIAKIAELYDLVWGDDELLNQVIATRRLLRPYILPDMKRRFFLSVVALYNSMKVHAHDVYETILEPAEAPEYPYEPLLRCVEERPEAQPFAISFSTTWGTFPTYGVGEVHRFDVPGIDEQVYSAAASNSFTSVPGPGNVSINISGFKLLSTTVNGISINMSPYKFLSGEDIIVNNLGTFAISYRIPSWFDPNNIELTGIVTNGILSLNEAGMNRGDAVSGTFIGEIIVTPPDYFQ
jgi:hypothetical protein